MSNDQPPGREKPSRSLSGVNTPTSLSRPRTPRTSGLVEVHDVFYEPREIDDPLPATVAPSSFLFMPRNTTPVDDASDGAEEGEEGEETLSDDGDVYPEWHYSMHDSPSPGTPLADSSDDSSEGGSVNDGDSDHHSNDGAEGEQPMHDTLSPPNLRYGYLQHPARADNSSELHESPPERSALLHAVSTPGRPIEQDDSWASLDPSTIGIRQTPRHHGVASLRAKDFNVANVHPMIAKDIDNSVYLVPHSAWLSARFGIENAKLAKLRSLISERLNIPDSPLLAKFKDVATTLASVNDEPSMYKPACDLANLIVHDTELLDCLKPILESGDRTMVGGISFAPHNKKAPAKSTAIELKTDQKYTVRFPDMVCVPLQGNGGAGGAGEAAAHPWSSILLTWEAKREQDEKSWVMDRPFFLACSIMDDSLPGFSTSVGQPSPVALPPALAVPSGESRVAAQSSLSSTGSANVHSGTRSKKRRRARADTYDSSNLPNKNLKLSKPSDIKCFLRTQHTTAMLQTANGALEVFRHTQGLRIGAPGITLIRTQLFLWHFDPCGVLRTENPLDINVQEDIPDIVLHFLAFAHFTPQDWGVIPDKLESGSYAPGQSVEQLLTSNQGLTGRIVTVETPDNEARRVRFNECIDVQPAAIGRRTVLYAVESLETVTSAKDKGPSGNLVAKLSYQAGTRTPEHVLIKRARAKNVPHIPIVYGHNDLFYVAKMSGSFRRRIHDHWPGFRTEDRVARVIVFPRYVPLLQRLHEHPPDLLTMVEQITDCLHALWYEAQILHRDVSAYNIMWQPSQSPETEGKFVLCDFDLAVVIEGGASAPSNTRVATATHRTGTLPFLAIELLENPKTLHRLYHDYESLFWVVLWCAMKADYHAEGTKRAAIDELLNEWEEVDLKQVASHKMRALKMYWNELPIPTRFKTPKNTKTLIRKFRALIQEAPNKVDLVQLEEENEFGKEIQDPGDIMDTIICKKKIMEIVKEAKT